MPKKLTGKEKHAISLKQAAKLTANHRKGQKEIVVKSLFFGGEALQKLLKQKGCIGLRAYYAKKDSGSPTLVLVGVAADGNDLAKGVILEWGNPCPPYCPKESPLNM
jgi:hypothetical protein